MPNLHEDYWLTLSMYNFNYFFFHHIRKSRTKAIRVCDECAELYIDLNKHCRAAKVGVNILLSKFRTLGQILLTERIDNGPFFMYLTFFLENRDRFSRTDFTVTVC